jgi:arylsulfatase A-like enzyme
MNIPPFHFTTLRHLIACGAFTLGALFAGQTALATSAKAHNPPNIVIILSDDQGWTDYGFMGHPVIETPHLDRLAAASLLFPHGYVAAPICRPSLASIVTGLLPSQHGVTGNDVVYGSARVEADLPLRQIFHQHPSIVRMLTGKGYLTFQSGKWWEGSYREGGFTHGMTHGDPARGGRHGDAGLDIGREGMDPIREFVDYAIEADKPFFVWYAPFLPHTPHNPPERLLEKYVAEGREMDVAKYFAMCEWFDETCGELIEILQQRGVLENTLVLYICDNGEQPPSVDPYDPKEGDWRPPYAMRTKASPFDMGIRTPIMLSLPGMIEPEKSPRLAHAIDLFPTIAAVTGLSLPPGLPGINLLDRDAVAARERVFVENHSTHNITIGDPQDNLQYLVAVEEEWKLILRKFGRDTTKYHILHSWDNEPARLYRIREDPFEQNNLAERYPDQVKRLKREIESWQKQ